MHRITRASSAAPLTAVALLALLTACGTGPATPSSSSDPGTSSTSSPTPDPSDSAASTAAPTPTPAPATLSDWDRENIRDAVSSGNYAALEGYFADPVEFIIMSSECCGPMSPADATDQMSYLSTSPGPWDFALPAATIAGWRTNQYYGSLFTGDDITGRAADESIVQFGITGMRITSVLLGFEEGFSY